VSDALRPFFSYFGAKWRLSGHCPPPSYERIVEPFAGSAGYSCRYGAGHEVLLVDLDPTIAGIWDYLIHAAPADILALPDLHPDQSTLDLDIHDDARSLIGFWLNKGVERPMRTMGAWGRKPLPGRVTTFWGPGVRQRIADQLPAIRRWQVTNDSFKAADIGPATYYVDPPYIDAGKRYVFGADGIDYHGLAVWCRSLQGQVMVAEAEGAHWLPFEPLATVKATIGSGKRRGTSVEVMWRNTAPIPFPCARGRVCFATSHDLGCPSYGPPVAAPGGER
jgi:hypothetical protein